MISECKALKSAVCNDMMALQGGIFMSIMPDVKSSVLFGTGESACYVGGQLNELSVQDGEETQLFRAMCDDEYISIVNNGNTFVPYDGALEKKWFAIRHDHAKKWAKWFYPNGIYKVVEITILKEALKYMFYVKMLDNIGPAYSADAALLNMIVRRLRLV
jgi:hypothetical protein